MFLPVRPGDQRMAIRRPAATIRAIVLALVLVPGVTAACEPTAPPGASPSRAPISSGGAPSQAEPSGPAPVAGKPALTIDGTTITIVGIGQGISPEFELPAGGGQMTVSVCASNQVIPFVTLYDAKDTKLAIVVEPEYELKALVGGAYYVDVATNPSCIWTIRILPG
jgi:hypothetical protein